MRRQLVLGAAAITTTIVLAFAIPLGIMIRSVANDRALTTGERAAQALAPVLASDTDLPTIEQVVRGLIDPAAGTVSVVRADGDVLGAAVVDQDAVALARQSKQQFSTPVDGGRLVLVPVAVKDGTDVITVLVPTSVLDKGVRQAWLLLGGLSVALVLAAIVVADRLARTVVLPVRDLAATAERLGQGDLEARVEPSGPPEVIEVGHVLNRLAGRIAELLAAERELVADLSHRLRTPITALRLDADGLHDPAERERVTVDVDELVRAVDRLIDEARRPVREGVGSSCDLAEVTRDRVRFWEVLAEEQGRTFTTDIHPGPCQVAATGDDVEAALDALLGNVLSHTPEGTDFRVSLGPAPMKRATDAPAWLLVLDDDGPGFPAEGVITRGSSGAGSTGLGLDIVRRTAEHTGGSVRLASSTSGGARIEVTFGAPTS
ncbi:MAG: sensor histidine kinase [Acidimicrobiales bacterium]